MSSFANPSRGERGEHVELAPLDLASDDDIDDSHDALIEDTAEDFLQGTMLSSSFSPAFIRPKWLYDGPGRRGPWYQRWPSSAARPASRLLRPRLTWRYVLFSALILYISLCWIVGSPLLASNLPGHSGPMGVGVVDIEVPLPDGPKTVSGEVFRETKEPAFQVESVLMTVYYPTARGFHSPKPRYPWVSRPISLTAKGYAKFAHADNFLTRPLFTFALWAIAGGITIPAEVDAPLFDASAEQEAAASKASVMVFSHGMASSRSDYTHFIGELASRGHVVAAVEHRDGSCPGSIVRLGPKDPGRPVVSFGANELELEGDVDEAAFKRAQLAFRDAEILAAINVLRDVHEGRVVNNSRSVVDTLRGWRGRLDLDNLVVGGHSLGATGALQALDTVPPFAAGGFVLDPGKSSGPLDGGTEVPFLVVHSESWSRTPSDFYGRPHFDVVADLVRNSTAPSWFFTGLGTAHPSVTDAPLLEPLLLGWVAGASAEPKEALGEYVLVAESFLRFVSNGKPEGLLEEAATHEKFGEWVSDKRKKEFSEELARHWQVHVSPRDLS